MYLQPLTADGTGKVSTFMQALISALSDETTTEVDDDGNETQVATGWQHASATELELFATIWRWAIDKTGALDTRQQMIPGDLTKMIVDYGGSHYILSFDEANYTIDLRKKK